MGLPIYTDEDVKNGKTPFLRKRIDLEFLITLVNSQTKKKDEIEDWNFREAYKHPHPKVKGQIPERPKPLEPYLIVVDDLMGDPAFVGFNSQLANFCTRSRHSKITFIWSAQVYTGLNDRIRSQSDMFVLLYMGAIKKIMFDELVDYEK